MAYSQPIFQVRGTQLKPYYSTGSSKFCTLRHGTSAADATVDTLATAGVFGSKVLNFTSSGATTARTLLYSLAGGNGPASRVMSVLARIVPLWTGTPATIQYLAQMGLSQFAAPYMVLWVNTAGKVFFQIIGGTGTILVNYTSSAALSFTNGVPTDVLVTWDGTNTSSTVNLYQDGSLVESGSPSSANTAWNQEGLALLQCGSADTGASDRGTNYYLNELCLWNSVQTPPASRSDFVSSLNLNGDTVPSASDVKSGVVSGLNTGTLVVNSSADVKHGVQASDGVGTYRGEDLWEAVDAGHLKHGEEYEQDGSSVQGTYRGEDLWDTVPVDRVDTGFEYLADGQTLVGNSDDPSEANVKLGVVYDNGTKTGTYTGADRWSDPGESNVAFGTTYKANSTTANKTGTSKGEAFNDEIDPSNVVSGLEYKNLGENKVGTRESVTYEVGDVTASGEGQEAQVSFDMEAV